MSSKLLLGGVVGIVIFTAGAYYVVSPIAKSEEEAAMAALEIERQNALSLVSLNSETAETDKVIEEIVEQEHDTTEDAVPVLPTPTPKPAPKPTPAPIPTSAPKPKPSGYTLSEVALHGGVSSCWTVVDGAVYDLTSYIKRHPGGEKRILSICGKDGTRAFEGQHAGDSKPESTLASFRIGALVQ